MDLASIVFIAAVILGLIAAFIARAIVLRRREALDTATLAGSVAAGRDLPPSLHPVIDPNICIGSLACIDACPEGDILGIVRGSAALIQGSACIGHGRCALECPVGAIKLVFGDSERGVDLPEVDENFQSSRPGVFVVGELGGMGLIKNAIAQGLEAGAFIASREAPPSEGIIDALIVGAGPAGLAAAAALRAAGRSFRVVEQGRFGGSIAHYPRHKVVATERARIPGYGVFGRNRMSKEELLAAMRALANKLALQVEEDVRVVGIDGAAGAFSVLTAGGESIAAKNVVLAVGRRGTPKRLGVPGEELAKVTFGLSDARQYDGRRVLIVGAGDAAAEAAIQLARESSAEVTVCCRGPAFGRARLAHRTAIEELVSTKRITVLERAEVRRIDLRLVDVAGGSGPRAIPNDFVIVCIGGEAPLGLLERAGVQMKHHRGEAPIPPPTPRSWRAGGTGSRPAPELEKRRDRRVNALLFAIGISAVLALAFLGRDYYLLSRADRLSSPLHEAFKSSGSVGNRLGLFATALMLTNFLYALRKRWTRLHGVGRLSRWMSFHVFVGLMSPAFVAFHAAFQANNVVATITFIALLIVVSTGLVGRYVYGLIPRASGRALEESELAAHRQRARAAVEEIAARAVDRAHLIPLIELAGAPHPGFSRFFRMFVSFPLTSASARIRAFAERLAFVDPGDRRLFRARLAALVRAQVELELYATLRGFLRWWRALHVVLAVLLVVLMALHIGISIYLGYGGFF